MDGYDEMFESGGDEPRLFEELSPGGFAGDLAGLDLPAGKLPATGEVALVGAARDQQPVIAKRVHSRTSTP